MFAWCVALVLAHFESMVEIIGLTHSRVSLTATAPLEVPSSNLSQLLQLNRQPTSIVPISIKNDGPSPIPHPEVCFRVHASFIC